MPQDDDECIIVDDHPVPVRRPVAVPVADDVINVSEEEVDDDDCVEVSPPAAGSIKLDCCSASPCLEHLNRSLDIAGPGTALHLCTTDVACFCNGSARGKSRRGQDAIR